MAFAYFLLVRFDAASAEAERALHLRPDWPPALRVLVMSDAHAGRLQPARQAMVRLRSMQPDLRIANFQDQFFLQRPEHMASCIDAMRKAGFPE